MSSSEHTSFLDRTLINLRNAWREFMSSGQAIKPLVLDPDLPDSDLALLRKLMNECLEARGGEVSSRARAAVLGQAYLGLHETGRQRYLELLAKDFTIRKESLLEVKNRIDEL